MKARDGLWLGEGERAFELLKKQLRPAELGQTNYTGGGGCYPNLFGAHPPFQIDSNFGACAGIAELLLQSSGDAITLLPAVPKALENGSVKGLRARGGITVSMEFSGGKVQKAELLLDAIAKAERQIKLCYNNKKIEVKLVPGKAYSPL